MEKNLTRWQHYSLDKIEAEKAMINLIYGERSNGKSYQVKHKKGVIKYLNTGKRFILVRRYKEEITSDKIHRYFADVDVESLTDGRYNTITYYRKEIYLATYDSELNKTIRGEKIGYVIPLTQEQNFAGASFLDVEDIIFEEFMSRGAYLSGEADKLMNLYSTVDRKRGIVRIWLVGNSISKICPYLVEWDLLKIIRTLKQGEITTKYLNAGTDEEPLYIKLAIEFCKSTGKTSFAIGKHKGMMNTGEWQTDDQPHLPDSINNYESLFRFFFRFKSFTFACDYIRNKKDYSKRCFFIYPKYTPFKKESDIVISDEINTNPNWYTSISTIRNRKLNIILDQFNEANIFYCTDMCGTDFKQAINFIIRR